MVKRKSILITGCSSGIGYDAAVRLHKRGWQVFAACRKAEDCAHLEAEGLTAPRLDYADPDSIHAALDSVLTATDGRLDAVFNNGAFGLPGLVEDTPTDALRTIFEANFFGWHTLTRAVLPVMRAQGGGRIIQCSSVLGFVTMPLRSAYCATKFALEAHADTLRQELRGTGIHVVLIQPGPITSALREKSIPHFERWIDWEQSAQRGRYERQLGRLYSPKGPDPFELPPRAVTDTLIRALTAPRPRTHYRVTTPTQIAAVLHRLLPARAVDWIVTR